MKQFYYSAVLAAIVGVLLIFSAQIALAQDVKIVCAGGEVGQFPYPIGYVATGTTYKADCGGVGFTPNAYIMEKPLGRKNLAICSIFAQAIPNGYVTTGVDVNPFNCFYDGRLAGDPGYTNVTYISIPDPRPDNQADFSSLNTSARRVCAGSPIPPGFAKTGDGGPDILGNCGRIQFGPNISSFVISRKLDAPVYFPYDARVLNFSDGRLLFESYDAGTVTPLNNIGNQDYPNGSIINSGPSYAHPFGFPYVMHDDKRDLILLHPGTFDTVKLGASVGYRASNGTYHFVGMFARANNFPNAGDGVSVAVFKNIETTPLFSAVIPSNYLVNTFDPFFSPGSTLFGTTYLTTSGIPFDLELSLTEGDVVRFVVFSGASNVDGTFDVTGLLLNATFTCPTITLGVLAQTETVAGKNYTQAVGVSPANTIYSYALTKGALPQGVTFNNGVITGVPTVTGKFTFTITATDGSGCSGSRDYSLTVYCPEIALPILANGALGTPYTQTIMPSGGIAPYRFVINGLPSGLMATVSSGGVVISGTPTQADSFSVNVFVSDANGCEGRKTSTLNIASIPCAIVVNPASFPLPVVGKPYTQSLSASPAGSYTFSLVAGALPPGLQLVNVLGVYVIKGTPPCLARIVLH